MKKWNYSVTTSTIWTSFDFGEVEAETYEEALKKAKEQIKYDFDKVNSILASCDPTIGFTIDYDESQIEVDEVE